VDLYDWRHPRSAVRTKTPGRQITLPWAALRGMSPDLHAPIIEALRERTEDLRERKRLLDSLTQISGTWPADFASDAVGEDRLSDSFLASFAHYADRFAAVPMLIHRAKAGSLGARVGKLYASVSALVSTVTTGAARIARSTDRGPRTKTARKTAARKK
jgi:hypothetical protein